MALKRNHRLRQRQRRRRRLRHDADAELRSGRLTAIAVKEVRVLGLFIYQNRRSDTTLVKLRKVEDQVGRMVRRVSNKRWGLLDKNALRLAHAFVTSRILYSTPYLHLRKQDEDALEVILRKIVTRAVDLPLNTSNQRLLGLGMVNTFRELREAHLTN